MPQAGTINIATLRKRISATVGRTSGGSERLAVPGSSPVLRKKRSKPKASLLGGTEQENRLGQFVLLERYYENGHLYGDRPIERLQRLDPSWIPLFVGDEGKPADPRRWAFLDSETTGLAGGTGTPAFLVGVGAVEANGFRVRLYFMRDYDEEAAMLHALATDLKGYEVVLTYNGKSFDIPLLETRYRLKRQRNPFKRMQHVDLLHPARRIWKERMSNCRLCTLEAEILGAERQGDVPGDLIPQRYFNFVRTGRPDPLKQVFHHNVLDIVSLAGVGSILMKAFAKPESAPLRHGQDLAGLAKWVAKSNIEQALALYRKAFQAGLPTSQLYASLWECSVLLRKIGNHQKRLPILRDLVRVPNAHRVPAMVELAKHYEHKEKDLEKALAMTRKAQRLAPSDDLCHREERLIRRVGKEAVEAAA